MMMMPLNRPVKMPPIDWRILSPESTAFFATAMIANTKHSRMPISAIAQYTFCTMVLPKKTSISVWAVPS